MKKNIKLLYVVFWMHIIHSMENENNHEAIERIIHEHVEKKKQRMTIQDTVKLKIEPKKEETLAVYTENHFSKDTKKNKIQEAPYLVDIFCPFLNKEENDSKLIDLMQEYRQAKKKHIGVTDELYFDKLIKLLKKNLKNDLRLEYTLSSHKKIITGLKSIDNRSLINYYFHTYSVEINDNISELENIKNLDTFQRVLEEISRFYSDLNLEVITTKMPGGENLQYKITEEKKEFFILDALKNCIKQAPRNFFHVKQAFLNEKFDQELKKKMNELFAMHEEEELKKIALIQTELSDIVPIEATDYFNHF
jgi:hypothetical protein